MRTLLKLAFAALLITAASPALAQGTGSSITVDQPYARATPSGATTGAVYLTLANKNSDG